MKALLTHLFLASRMFTGGHEKGFAWFGLDEQGRVQDNGIQDQLFSWEGFEEDSTFTDMIYFDCVLKQPLGDLPAGTHADVIELELSTSTLRVYKTRKGKRVNGISPDELLFEGTLALSVQPKEQTLILTEEKPIPVEEKNSSSVVIPDEEEEEELPKNNESEVDDDDTF